MRVLTVVGARPQFVKAAPVSRALGAAGHREVLVHTGQHYDASLSDVFFAELGLANPDHHLGVGSLPHGAQTGRMLEAIEKVIEQEQPDWVLVFGDTNSTLAGALAAAKRHVRVAHVEAGLRSFNRRMPEELNRILVDHAADLLLVPTAAAVANLAREGISGPPVQLVGDVMEDAALLFGDLARERSRVLERLGLASGTYALATVHRAETTDAPDTLRAVFGALGALARDLPVVVPLHPRTRVALERAGVVPKVRLIEPVGYLDMIALERGARLIATDSGGIQKEAYFHRVPCVTLRGETEWVELLAGGWNRLAPPTDAAACLAVLREALSRPFPPADPLLYGGGKAGERIVAALATSGARPGAPPV